MPTKQQKLIIIDGNALIHRAYHALPPLTTKDGTLINAAYGFTSIFLKVLKELKPEYVAVTFDRAKKTFRDELYHDYKATRVKQPDELYNQIPMVKEIIRLFNIPIYELDGYEADDVIGTICHLKTVDQPDIESVIVTGDLDTLQLVDDNTHVYTLKKGLSDTLIYDEKAVQERFSGLSPNQMIDYKALRGDASDNIPGVKGIGEKTAIALLNEFSTLDNVYKNIKSSKIKESVRSKLIDQKDNAYLSQKLATIVIDVPINFKLQDAALKPFDLQAIIPVFQKYEFKTLLSKIPGEKEATASTTVKGQPAGSSGVVQEYKTVKTEKDFEVLVKLLAQQKEFAFDTETTDLDPFTATLMGISFCFKAGQAYYVPIAQVEGVGLFEKIKLNESWLKKLKPILEDEKIKKIAHNFKFDAQILKLVSDIKVQPFYFDTMVASYLLNPGSRNHNLDTLAFAEFGYQKISFDALVGKGKDRVPITQVPLEKLGFYSCEDADFCFRLYHKIKNQLEEIKVTDLFTNIEMPLIPVLMQMEEHGIKVDKKYLAVLAKELDQKIEKLTGQIHQIAGAEFNIASPLQLKEILFEKLKISAEGIAKTKTGISTAASELDKLRGRHKIIDLISEYRELTKLQSTYVEALPKLINDKTGRVHTSFNQTITATGRLSSSNPNLQNIPIRTEIGQKMRQAFVAEKGNKILTADYSQIELRIVAHLANDKNMIEIFKKGEDIHTSTAAKIHNLPLDQVTKEIRRTAKEVNFGVLYGMGIYGLSARTGISREKAADFIKKYFETFKGVKKYLDMTKEFAADNGFVETLFGRRRYLPEIHSGVQNIRAAAERMAVNMPVQGTAADLIKMAMIKIAQTLPKISPEAKMILQVHDELIFELPEKQVEKTAEYIKKTMENIYELKVPIVVDINVGDNWQEAK